MTSPPDSTLPPKGLWNSQVAPKEYGSETQYYEHMFAQYKIFVDAAEQVSARRNIANTFFLTLHTLLLGIVAFSYDKVQELSYPQVIIVPLLSCLGLCYVWWQLLKSYRQLNTAKYQVIAEYERRLPSLPYWHEWILLGEGKNRRLYQPLSNVEQLVPVVVSFCLLYTSDAADE